VRQSLPFPRGERCLDDASDGGTDGKPSTSGGGHRNQSHELEAQTLLDSDLPATTFTDRVTHLPKNFPPIDDEGRTFRNSIRRIATNEKDIFDPI
jgi:hypothetical protein